MMVVEREELARINSMGWALVKPKMGGGRVRGGRGAQRLYVHNLALQAVLGRALKPAGCGEL
jgi:hypothetical protein